MLTPALELQTLIEDKSRVPSSPSICFIAHNAYGVLAEVDTAHAGGIEVQVPLMAKWFARQGYEVSMITWDFGFPDGQEIKGVKLRKLCRKEDGVPIVRFVWPRWTSFNSALERANADVYYYNCGDLGLGQLALWAGKRGKKVVYSVANDVDCQAHLPALKPMRERLLYRYGIKRADAIVTQTVRQQTLLKSDFGLDAKVISMPSKGFPLNQPIESKVDSLDKFRVLWVGRIIEEKRLEWLFEVARRLPDVEFDVVGAPNAESEYAERCYEEEKQLPNVTMRGRLPHKEMHHAYERAHVLCSTSVFEGFPNVFLEAWSMGLPLVTTFDPDGVVDRHGHGCSVEDIDGLVSCISSMRDKDVWLGKAKQAREYYLENHQVENLMGKFEKIICGSIDN